MTNFNVLQNNLEELSLFKMKEILPNVIEKSVKSNTALQDSLIELTGAEIAFRDERARKINITVSHFPYIKTVKDFDFSYQPTINKEQVTDFLSLRFIEQKSNIIFVGSSGVGKTHFATAIGIEAASKRISTYFINFAVLMEKFKQAAKENRVERVVKHYLKYTVLIIDEIGYLPVDELLHLVSFSLLPQGMNTDLPSSPQISLFQNGPMFSAMLLLPTQSLTGLFTIATSSKLPVISTVLRVEISSMIPMINFFP